MNKRGYFITGTDTNVGKTFISVLLMRKFSEYAYYKPVQSGDANTGGDTEFVRKNANLSDDRLLPPVYSFSDPVSPHLAARLAGMIIQPEKLLASAKTDRPLLIEGAGGVLVPVNEKILMIDLIKMFDLPAIIVARSSLGTINHTLLTLEALRARNVSVAGVILNGAPDPENRSAIEQYGRVDVIGEVPPCHLSDQQVQNKIYLSIK